MQSRHYQEKVDKYNFPGTQGGPFMHAIAAKAVCFKEAMSEDFKAYQRQVVANARTLARCLIDKGFEVVSGGTDTHLFLIDLTNKGLSGKKAEKALEAAGITVNKNTVPFDQKSPFVTSGIRVGTSGADHAGDEGARDGEDRGSHVPRARKQRGRGPDTGREEGNEGSLRGVSAVCRIPTFLEHRSRAVTFPQLVPMA